MTIGICQINFLNDTQEVEILKYPKETYKSPL